SRPAKGLLNGLGAWARTTSASRGMFFCFMIDAVMSSTLAADLTAGLGAGAAAFGRGFGVGTDCAKAGAAHNMAAVVMVAATRNIKISAPRACRSAVPGRKR